jgi:hypothetical protein
LHPPVTGAEARYQNHRVFRHHLWNLRLSDSRCGTNHAPLAMSSNRQTGSDVLEFQFGVISRYFVIGHAGRKPAQHVVYRDAHVATTGFFTALSRLQSDSLQHLAVLIVHIVHCPNGRYTHYAGVRDKFL